MVSIRNMIPRFFGETPGEGPLRELFNYKRTWQLTVSLTAAVTLVPLIVFAIIDYNLTKGATERENELRTARLASNTRRTISYFLDERLAAMNFVLSDNRMESLSNTPRLSELLEHLKASFGGFTDLGLLDKNGHQMAYAGPYDLEGRDYSGQEWFKEVASRGLYVSEVFRGFRDAPHIVLAVKHGLPGDDFRVLRTTLDMERFNNLLAELDISAKGDAFLVNAEGVLQTPTRTMGDTLTRISLPVPEFTSTTNTIEYTSKAGHELLISYSYITGTPFVLMVVKDKEELMHGWYEARMQLVGALTLSVLVVLMVVLGVPTYLVNKIYVADRNRVRALRQAEHVNKMASVGRLASGVAHEINNPLAVIGEKAGLLKDLITFKGCSDKDVAEARLIPLADAILASVDRCGAITKRLLGFARHMDVAMEKVSMRELIPEVLGFLGKEAEYRSITVHVDVPEDLPEFVTDRGKLQQILLNLVNNAFAAVSDGGRIDVSARREDQGHISLTVQDDGTGIPEEDLKRIFEPFFTTKSRRGGTGLGLSITYGIVKKLGGDVKVSSTFGQGSTFTIILPLRTDKYEEGKECEFC